MARLIATLGPIGFLPAPGTMASLAALLLVYVLRTYASDSVYLGTSVTLFFLGTYVVQRALLSFGDVIDPSQIVIDEVVGCLFTFACISLNLKAVILGFLLFRLLDIFKFGLIKKCEKLPGAWGIMIDDVVAGIIANIALQIFLIILM